MPEKGSATLGFLSVQALKVAAPLLAPCVAALFNLSALVGCLPPSWAVSAITPIFKSGDIDVPGNYRGIAVGTVLSKLFAKLINATHTGLKVMEFEQQGRQDLGRITDAVITS